MIIYATVQHQVNHINRQPECDRETRYAAVVAFSAYPNNCYVEKVKPMIVN